MKPLFDAEQTAAMELAGFAIALLDLDAIPAHLAPGLTKKVNAYQRAIRLPEYSPDVRTLEAAE